MIKKEQVETLIELATEYLNDDRDTAIMSLNDARALADKMQLNYARERALKSIEISVGTHSAIFRKARSI